MEVFHKGVYSSGEVIQNYFSRFAYLSFILIAIVSLGIFLEIKPENNFCGDGSFEGECSLVRPYICFEGNLTKDVFSCGCSELFENRGEICFSPYEIGLKKIGLEYFLNDETGVIPLNIYRGVNDYVASLPKTITSSGEGKISRKDFKLKNINDELQRQFLLPLVVEIQNRAETKEDQFRLAVSLVQNIPFGGSDKNFSFFNGVEIQYPRHPYEVLYDYQGVCGEKSELLIFLLRELGYGTAMFYYAPENHEAVGVKCPVEFSVENTGYCFVETTGPSIITDEEIVFTGIGKLESSPELMVLSEGYSLPLDMYEYEDADSLGELNKILHNGGKINPLQAYKLRKLEEKYHLSKVYNP